jgi:diguanylate cyclase (GGDEF)-like protein
MVECTRQSDTVARVGGDEFVIIFEGVNEPKVLAGLAKRLIRLLEEPVPYGGKMCKVSASAGTTLSTWNSGTVEAAAMLHQADLALYAAKRAGRSQHLFYEEGMQKGDPETVANGVH